LKLSTKKKYDDLSNTISEGEKIYTKLSGSIIESFKNNLNDYNNLCDKINNIGKILETLPTYTVISNEKINIMYYTDNESNELNNTCYSNHEYLIKNKNKNRLVFLLKIIFEKLYKCYKILYKYLNGDIVLYNDLKKNSDNIIQKVNIQYIILNVIDDNSTEFNKYYNDSKTMPHNDKMFVLYKCTKIYDNIKNNSDKKNIIDHLQKNLETDIINSNDINNLIIKYKGQLNKL